MAALYSELAAKQVQARIQKNIGAKVGKMEYDSDEDIEDGTWEHKVSVSTCKSGMGIRILTFTGETGRDGQDSG